MRVVLLFEVGMMPICLVNLSLLAGPQWHSTFHVSLRSMFRSLGVLRGSWLCMMSRISIRTHTTPRGPMVLLCRAGCAINGRMRVCPPAADATVHKLCGIEGVGSRVWPGIGYCGERHLSEAQRAQPPEYAGECLMVSFSVIFRQVGVGWGEHGARFGSVRV